MSNTPDLQPSAADTRRPLVVGRKAVLRRPLTNAVWTSDGSTSYRLNARCQDLISRYLGHSLISPDDAGMVQVNRKLLELAFDYPFLMHASLAVALTYDRHLNGPVDCRRTLEECYHWSQSTKLLHKRLSDPIRAKDKDPIWGTAAALIILTFSSPAACTPEEAWPLKKSPDSSELDWLGMSNAKMSLWPTIDPLRPDSLFRVIATIFASMYSPLIQEGIEGIPKALADACKLEESSTPATNPYFHAAHAVSQISKLADSEVTTVQVELFMRSIHNPLKALLRQRDPAALLLLYLWYRKASRGIWWVELRARVECPSICLYLRLYHKDDSTVQAFLPGGAFADGWV